MIDLAAILHSQLMNYTEAHPELHDAAEAEGGDHDEVYERLARRAVLRKSIAVVVGEVLLQSNWHDDDSVADIVAHLRNTIALPGQPAVGALELIDYTEDGRPDRTFPHYVVVLAATDDQITEALNA